MTSPRLSVLKRQLKIQTATPSVPATPVAGDLADALQQYIDAAISKALGNAPPKPQQAKLAVARPAPPTAATRLAALDAQLAALGHAAPVNPPSRPLREVFENIPAATKVSPLPATELIAPPPRQKLTVTARDANGYLKTLTFGEEGKADLDLMVVDRDGNNHIAAIQVNQRLFRVFRDANGHIAEVVS